MDELQLRRHCIAAPNDQDAEFLAQLAAQPAAQKVAAQARHFDQRLSLAVNQVPSPDGLAARILFSKGIQLRRRRRRLNIGLAMAASLLLSATLLLWPKPATQPQSEFAALALQHVYGEIGHLEHAGGTVSDTTVSGLFAQLGGQLDGKLGAALGKVSFAFMCPTPHGRGLHLIADNAAGRVTLLYMPNTPSDENLSEFSDQRFVGLAMRPASGGSLAIIGENQQAVKLMANDLQEHLQWQTPTRAAERRTATAYVS